MGGEGGKTKGEKEGKWTKGKGRKKKLQRNSGVSSVNLT